MGKVMMMGVALAAMVAAAPVGAEPLQTIVVHAAELKAGPAHVSLRKRIASAIEQVCGSYATIEPYQQFEMGDCWAEAWRSADTQIAALKGDGTIRLASR